ncbi:MAG: hypothetical protein A2086_03415 [Spirochaetes bacterium GWD1_27_9]|nr:MAG: hypothetical protein A2Z98_14735 [Spirochaetes bacterium GWB1_27_13]OHD24825.1 MAG: hypothetical protein A2Y34_08300 [Spirochaetes bacterium GWC1_27_15]OHD45224.1 MAG: hypothetical protein A2086_03415 [Spirochaetes bacterium GWD1_27_9]
MNNIDLSEKNIFFIEDKIEDFGLFIKSFPTLNQINIYNFDNFINVIKQKKSNLTRRNTLIILAFDFLNNEILEKIKSIFFETYEIKKPYFLCIFRKEPDSLEKENLIKGEAFYYIIPEREYFNSNFFYFNFCQFVEIVFEKIVSSDRINDYIIKSFQIIADTYIINKQKKQIEKLYFDLELMSKVDYLTNVLNKKAFFESLESEKKRTLRDLWRIKGIKNDIEKEKEEVINEKPDFTNLLENYGKFSCMMIDIDFFKKINDTYGHLVGDQVLRKIGELLTSKAIFREHDIIGRYGGEEFIVILPETSSKNALIPAERLRTGIKEIIFSDEKSNTFYLSLSIGISEFYSTDKNNEEIIGRADKALYYAKRQGRDQTIIYEDIVDKIN